VGNRILKVAESGINKEKSRNILQYLAIKKVQRTGSQQLKISGGGEGMKDTGSGKLKPPVHPPPPRSRCKKLFLIILRAHRQVVMQEILFRALFIA